MARYRSKPRGVRYGVKSTSNARAIPMSAIGITPAQMYVFST